MTTDQEAQDQTKSSHGPSGEEPDVNERLWLPLLIPVIVFTFALLVIYGLSRIYIELNHISIGDVTMATPLAVGVSLYILFAAWYLASKRTVPMWQTASIMMVAVVALTGGAIWATVDDLGDDHDLVENGTEEPTPPVGEGQVLVGLVDPTWDVTASPSLVSAGDLTFIVENQGGLVHNLRTALTDLAEDQLPLDATGIMVDEAELNIVASTPDFTAPDVEEIQVTLDPGNYILFCNIAGHYDAGMHGTLTVE